ncbi:MAG: hypothetical protein Q4Q23_07690, partial [Methanobacteriaceae archaeon]|nr:hypothetical protein [Methanobacteriaceae archaeon]
MYVRVLIQSEHNKILLLKKQSKNNNNIWEIPGAEVTDEENFDDVAITSIHEKTGYLITTDKIVGITEFENRLEKRNEVHIIMEADIISGNLNIIDPYDGYSWIEKYKIKEYPLASWLKKYIKENPTPFEDVQEELNKELGERPQQIFDDDEKEEIKETFTEETDAVKETVKGSLSLLKETIIRTFKPRQIDVDKTTPKDFPIYKDNPNVEETQYSPDISLKQESIKEDENEIIPEHAIQTEEIIPETANIEETIPETKEEIMIDHTEEIIPEHVPSEDIIPETTNIEETIPETKEE